MLPKPILPWGEAFKALFKRVDISAVAGQQVIGHIDRILSLLSTIPADKEAILSRLNESQLWRELEIKSQNQKTVQTLKEIYKKHQIYLHLSAQQLMQMHWDQSTPIEYHLENLVTELESQIELEEQYLWWKTKASVTKKKETLDKLRQMRTDFLAWQQQVFDLIEYKSSVCQLFELPKEVDDVLFYLSQKIENLNLLSVPLPTLITPNADLSDDTRIAIYDFLVMKAPSRKKTLEKIIKPVNQNPKKPPLSKGNILQENSSLEEVCLDVESALDLKTSVILARRKECVEKEGEKQSRFNDLYVPKFLLKFSDYGPQFGGLARLYHWRAMFIALFPIALYFVLMPSILPLLTLNFGVTLSNFVAQGAFYGMAMLPTWYYLGKTLKGLGSGFKNFLAGSKNQEIELALEVLKTNQKYMTAQLSAGILDLAHFDIRGLKSSVEKRLAALEICIQKVQKKRWFEWPLIYFGYPTLEKKVIDQLNQQKSHFEIRLKAYAKFIAQHIEKEIQLFEKKLHEETWSPRIPEGQFKALSDFVKNFGEASEVIQFKNNTQVIFLFAKDIIQLKFGYRGPAPDRFSKPWGDELIYHSALNKWRILIQQMVLEDSQRQNAEILLNLVSDKSYCDLKKLEDVVDALQIENKKSLISYIQQTLFQTLSNRSPEAAQLLNHKQKQKILGWYQDNQENIEAAFNFIKKVFTEKSNQLQNVSEEQLAKYYQWLEGAECAQYCGQKSLKKTPWNIAKQYFERYQGENDRAVYLLRFLPETQRQKALVHMAQMRLDYLIRRAENLSSLSQADLELFNDQALLSGELGFNFTQAARAHPCFLEHTSLDGLLGTFVRSGLMKKQNLVNYQRIHGKENFEPQTTNSIIHHQKSAPIKREPISSKAKKRSSSFYVYR